MPPRPRSALRKVPPSRASCASTGMGPLLLSMMGSSTSSGTTAMSCSSRMPRQAAPKRLDSWLFSCKILSTKAEEDSDSAAPMTSASSTRVMSTRPGSAPTTNSRNCTPPTKGNTKKASVDSSTCSDPMPNAYLDSPRSRSTVSSRPCSNSRNSTPKSANDSMSLRSENSFRPHGPMRRPADRKPMTGDALSHLNRGTIPMVEHRKMSRSLPNGFNEPSPSPFSKGLSKRGVTAVDICCCCCGAGSEK
mmetsp:Transcript_12571/g.17263  ORF Transcript_12571/g.17263 Transcript_12571/m.17263 type:complete len:248 (+) Transcript_12571:1116-1859(+)